MENVQEHREALKKNVMQQPFWDIKRFWGKYCLSSYCIVYEEGQEWNKHSI